MMPFFPMLLMAFLVTDPPGLPQSLTVAPHFRFDRQPPRELSIFDDVLVRVDEWLGEPSECIDGIIMKPLIREARKRQEREEAWASRCVNRIMGPGFCWDRH